MTAINLASHISPHVSDVVQAKCASSSDDVGACPASSDSKSSLPVGRHFSFEYANLTSRYYHYVTIILGMVSLSRIITVILR